MQPIGSFFHLSKKKYTMKKTLTLFILLVPSFVFSQSNSFSSLKENFAGGEDVVHVILGGFFMRTAIWMMDEDDSWLEAAEGVKNFRFMNIPKREFEERGLKLNSFRKFVMKDNFQQLLTVKENGEWVEFYIQEGEKNKNRYLVIAEAEDEVSVFELTGFIDLEKLAERNRKQIQVKSNL
jgi:hypothetical protein